MPLMPSLLYTWRYLLHDPIMPDDQVAGILGVKVLVGAVVEEQVRGPQQGRVHPDVLGTVVITPTSHVSPYRDVAVLGGLPLHVRVVPVQRQPVVRGQDLILLVKVDYLLQPSNGIYNKIHVQCTFHEVLKPTLGGCSGEQMMTR